MWDRLATDLRPRHLDDVTRVIALEALPPPSTRCSRGGEHGRIVVKVRPA